MSGKERLESTQSAAGTVRTRSGKTVNAKKTGAKEAKAGGNQAAGENGPAAGTAGGGNGQPDGKAEHENGQQPNVMGRDTAGQLELTFPPTEDEKAQEAIIEAVLFTMGNSVELRQLAVAIGQNQEVARKAVERLMKRYRSAKCGMEITQLEDSYQMCTKAVYYENLIRVAATPKKQVLTEVTLETLSIIAYKQPVTKMEIEKIRGVKSDHAVNRLVEYNLVYEVGRLDAPGRPALFATTEEFLRRFGVGSVQDLPDINPEQEAEIKAQVEEELQLKLEEIQVREDMTDGEDFQKEENLRDKAAVSDQKRNPGHGTSAGQADVPIEE